MNIVFVNRYFYPDHSPTSQLLSELAFNLAERGYNVQVIASRQRYKQPGADLPPQEIIRGVLVRRIWTTWFGGRRLIGRAVDYLSFYLSAAWQLFGSVRRGDVVILKTDPPLLSVVAMPVLRIRGATAINWLQDVFPEVASVLGTKRIIGVIGRPLAWARDRSLHAARYNVVLGSSTCAYLVSRGISLERIRVIENWADGQVIQPIRAANNPLRMKWGLINKFVVGYAGNMGRVHEFKTLLQAAERLATRNDIAFVFIGEGRYKKWLELEVQRRQLSNVQFHTYQPREELSETLSTPDTHIVCLRSELEGFVVPSKFYGITAAGRPTIFIGAHDGEIVRKLRQFRCGISIVENDHDGLVSAIVELAENEELRLDFAANARRAFEVHWDVPAAIRAWTVLLKDVCRCPSPG